MSAWPDEHLHDGAAALEQGDGQRYRSPPEERLADALELVEQLLEPQFVGLMHDDEKKFVLVVGLALLLQAEQVVEPQVVAVGQFIHRASPPHTSRARPRASSAPATARFCQRARRTASAYGMRVNSTMTYSGT